MIVIWILLVLIAEIGKPENRNNRSTTYDVPLT
jgi:hypothetical protein